MNNKPITESLNIALADSYALYLKTHNYHWNVVGPSFRSLHMMFEDQYTDLAVAVDDIAERIRSLGEKAPGTFSEFSELTSIKEGDKNASANDMVKDLAQSQDQIVGSLKEALNIAQKADDEVTADLLIGRMAIHEKAAWMLKSTTI
ncbi:MAG: Dps family protein [Alphaproteobacteria bacterium]